MPPFDYVFHFVDLAERSPGTLIGAVMTSLQTPAGDEPNQRLPVAGFSRGALKALPRLVPRPMNRTTVRREACWGYSRPASATVTISGERP